MSRTKLTVRNEVVDALVLEALRLGANTPEIMEVRKTMLTIKSATKSDKVPTEKTPKISKSASEIQKILDQYNLKNLTPDDIKVATVLQREYKKNDEIVTRYSAKIVYKPESFKEGVETLPWVTLKTPMKTEEAAWNLIESTLKQLDATKVNPVA